MKKSLSKVLARMAKDGDIETVAEFIEEMIGPEAEPVEEAAEAVAEAVAEAAEPEGTPAVENAETVIAIDEESLNGILSRLDRIITLLTPAAADENPEEIAEAIEEAIEAAADPMGEEVSAAMEEILEPVSSVILEEEEDGEDPLPEALRTDDALRAALAAVRPVLARMPKKARRKMAGDIAARLRSTRASGRGTTGTDAYAALASARRRTAPASADLGRKIMEKRNANYHG